MKDKTGRKVKTFELKTFEDENKTGRKVEEQSGNRGKKSGFKTLSNFFLRKISFYKSLTPKGRSYTKWSTCLWLSYHTLRY